jgi:hypothetical protein
LPVDKKEGTAAFLFKTHRTFKQMMIKANIRGAFQEVVFEFDMSGEPCPLRFNEEKLGMSPDFEKISALDFVFEKLSTCCQTGLGGSLN